MSYCVNCGVELDESAKKCVLCDTLVVNPAAVCDVHSPPPYPDNITIPKAVSKKYSAFIVSMVILIPNIVCVITNLLIPESGRWALYVVASSILLWLLFVFPFLLKKEHPYLLLSADAAAILLYLYIFFARFRQDGWYFQLAMPIIVFFFLICLFMFIWLSRKRDSMYIAIAVLSEIALFSVYADFLINRFYDTGRIIAVSIVIAASCLALIAFFIFAATNKRFRAWLKIKFFV